MSEYANKLYQLEEEKEQHKDTHTFCNELVLKTNLIVFQLDRQEQYIRRENYLIHGVEEDKEDNRDGEKVLFKIADELEIDLQGIDIQRVNQLGQTRRNKENPRPITARFVSYKKEMSFLLTKRISKISKEDGVFVCEDLTPLQLTHGPGLLLHTVRQAVTMTQTCNYCRDETVSSNATRPQRNEKSYAVKGS